MFLTFPERPACLSRNGDKEADIKMLTPISIGRKRLFYRLPNPVSKTLATLHCGERVFPVPVFGLSLASSSCLTERTALSTGEPFPCGDGTSFASGLSPARPTRTNPNNRRQKNDRHHQYLHPARRHRYRDPG